MKYNYLNSEVNEMLKKHKYLKWSSYSEKLYDTYTYVLKKHSLFSMHDEVFNHPTFLKNCGSIEWSYERNINELKRIILELSFSCLNYECGSKVSTGGFIVQFCPNKYLNIWFGNEEPLFSIKINNRKNKIKRLLY